MIEILSLMTTVIVGSIISLIIYYNNPNNATNRAFSFLGFNIVIWSVVNYLSLHSPSPQLQLTLIRLSMAASTSFAFAFFLLAHTFPHSKLQLRRKQLVYLASITLVTMFVTLTPLVFSGVEIEAGNISPIPGPGMILFIIVAIGFDIAAIYLLIKKYLQSTGVVKQQLLFILIGVLLTITLIVLTNFILVIVFKTSQFVSLGYLFTLIFLGTTAYSIMRHKLLDIRLLVARTVSFTLVTAIIILVSAIGLFAFTQVLPPKFSTATFIILAVILAYSFNPIQKLIEKLTKNVFYKNPYSSEELLEKLAEDMRSTLSRGTLANTILNELHHTMHVDQAVFLISDDKNKSYHYYHIDHMQKPEFSENQIHNLTKQSGQQMLIFEDLTEGPKKMLLRQHDISVVIPLRVKNTNHGLLLLGQKASGEIYSQQDIDVLEILMPQLSVAIQNAKQYSEIKHFADTLEDEVDKATKELKDANKELRHLDKLKDEFVFIATHELKNPVTAMRGYLSMIQEGSFGKIPKQMQEPVDELQESNQQLVNLVNNLLQIARTEAKTLTINTQPVNLCSEIETVTKNLKPLADQKDLKLTHECTKEVKVKADENRITEILNNLISNAIKYSVQGTITITHEKKDNKIVTHVTDQGVGIAKKDQEKLFTRFFRVEEEAAKGIPGTGLGLFIVKQLIEKMGGKIWFESEIGKGSTFSFSLPKA